MSEELKDFRGKITPLTWCHLEAKHRSTGRDVSEIVREILHDWASDEQDAFIEVQKLLKAEGIAGNHGESK